MQIFGPSAFFFVFFLFLFQYLSSHSLIPESLSYKAILLTVDFDYCQEEILLLLLTVILENTMEMSLSSLMLFREV